MIIEKIAHARAGLLGNPSDGYFGKTISISVRNFAARVSLQEHPELKIDSHVADQARYPGIDALCEHIDLHGYYGGVRLMKAAIRQFVSYCRESDIKLPKRNFIMRYHSAIPRQIGLAGSSALVTAALKGLQAFYEVKIPKTILPGLSLNAEAKELGINAGLQDRVIQVYGGCVFMDFDEDFMSTNGHGQYQEIDPMPLKNIYIAYKTELSKVSGTVLNDIRSRYDAGDTVVRNTLSEIAELAEKGKELIATGDLPGINALINRNFDLRSKIMVISDSNRQLVEAARICGASAKFTGSGGSIIGFYEDEAMLKALIKAMRKLKARVIEPRLEE